MNRHSGNGRFVFLSVVLLACVVLIAAKYQEKGGDRKDLIKFSHKFHIEDVEAECESCHTSVTESKSANDNNLPTMDDCSSCHDVEDEENCLQCHVSEEVLEPFPNPQRNILFNHQFHIENQELACTTCHKGLDKVDYASPANLPDMAICATCHNNERAQKTCSVCHPAHAVLLPEDHQQDWKREHARLARVDADNCQMCHSSSDCQECHQGPPLIEGKDGVGRFGLFLPSNESKKGQVIDRVHDLNYLYTHPMDAKGKVFDCQTCHEVTEFCTECHLNQNVVGSRRPVWHGGPDWGAIAGGVGTGGGRHAELAKRDLDNCAVCHDVQGNDPTCLLCHRDPDGIKGTDPRTHEPDFASQYGENSGPHDDNALCFACHVNTHQAGVGFCGYCHGNED